MMNFYGFSHWLESATLGRLKIEFELFSKAENANLLLLPLRQKEKKQQIAGEEQKSNFNDAPQ